MLGAGANSGLVSSLPFSEGHSHCYFKTLGSDGLGEKYNLPKKEKRNFFKVFYAVAQLTLLPTV